MPIGNNIAPVIGGSMSGEFITEESITRLINRIIATAPELVTLSAKNVVLNLDEEYFENIVKRMKSEQIELLIVHMDRLKLLAEKVLIDRA
jgi:hypothetical protein